MLMGYPTMSQASRQPLVAERHCPLVSVPPTLFSAWPHIGMERLEVTEAPGPPQQVVPCKWLARALHRATGWAEVRVAWVPDLASPYTPQ